MVQASLEEALQTARREVQEHSEAKAKLQEATATAQERLDEAQGHASELSGKLAEAAEVAKAAKGAAAAAERKHEEDQLALERAAKDKVMLEALSRETLEPLVSGEGLGEARAVQIQALVTALLSLGLDKAMLVSSRSALGKEPAAAAEALDRQLEAEVAASNAEAATADARAAL